MGRGDPHLLGTSSSMQKEALEELLSCLWKSAKPTAGSIILPEQFSTGGDGSVGAALGRVLREKLCAVRRSEPELAVL